MIRPRAPHTSPDRPWLAWKSWETTAIDLSGLPKEVNTHDIFDAFSSYGNIVSIDLRNGPGGEPGSKGRIRFRPAPENDFWTAGSCDMKLRSGRVAHVSLRLVCGDSNEFIPSPVRANIKLPGELELKTTQVDIGILLSPSTVHFMQSFHDLAYPRYVVDVKRKCLLIYFKVGIRGSETAEVTQHDYRVKIPFLQLTQVYDQFDETSRQKSLLFILTSAAICHRKTNDIRSTLTEERNWNEEDSWYRQTSVTHNPNSLKSLSTNLKKAGHIIDLGRWNVFKITFSPDENHPPDPDTINPSFLLMNEIFADYNISVNDGSAFVESLDRPVPVWNWIDFSESKSNKASTLLQDLGDKNYVHLPFTIRYQLEVCLSQGFLSEFTMDREFVEILKGLGDDQARRLLEFVATEKKQYLDPKKIFDLKCVNGVSDLKIKSYCCFMHTARVTPTTIYFNTPCVDVSNRVVREFTHAGTTGRFLRVRFTDEKTEGRINSSFTSSNDEIYTRVKRTLSNGITIGDRHYEFLAFGNSQFREHGAYFVAPDAGVSAASIRAWMGQFNHIRNVAKYAARLGQCFSTTRAYTSTSVQLVPCEDIVRNDFTFSDGVGKISEFLAKMVREEHDIKTLSGELPSAFQFRLGGAKGMLAVSPDPQPHEVHIRPSQQKFEANKNGLEIIRWSQYSIATLNRQLILVLSALGIPDEVFHVKLKSMLDSLYRAMCNDLKAVELLQRYIDPNQITIKLSNMVADGFRRSEEPFVNTMLELWKSWHLKHLKEKAKIVIDQGANLLGVIDETGVLKGYFKDSLSHDDISSEDKLAALPEIFVQICRPQDNGVCKIIEGLCILARNPSLHPGDIRVVRAVNRPELRDLRDVIVFPQTGDQDISSMCSGGDLDGDDYLVIWDPDLIPQHWFIKSMDYKGSKAPDLNHDVTVDEVTSFFVTYMKNDCLPRIAHAHLAWADQLPKGVWEKKCIRLAQLHSDAVDYNKSGAHARMERSLNPRDWPHFMEKRYKKPSSIYKSSKILGQLYDAVVTTEFAPNLEKPFDSRILESPLAAGSDQFMEFARNLKAEYDTSMRQIMAQYEINTEFEVWSTFVLRHGFVLKDYKMQEDLGGIVGTLRRAFQRQCYDKVGRHDGPICALVIAMYRVTQEQVNAALEAQREEKRQREDLSIVEVKSTAFPLISFPWLFPDVLGQIAKGKARQPREPEEVGSADSTKPVNGGRVYTHEEILDIIGDMDDNMPKPKTDPQSDSVPRGSELLAHRRVMKPKDGGSGVCLDEDDEKEGGVQLTIDEVKNKNTTKKMGGENTQNGQAKAQEIVVEVEDIVEGEGDLKPSALDALLNMMNIN
ncbi:hypothetical protein N7457_005632 [Penicillium paradoxum]|uniref:uncharacterized protein n=1 Tax=Penicillium paradoxum TaxID=176176 RepID=UPI0025472BB2|nr:uncharacterized protein N7457_005632 [Penicillium paradoxum]KAJ5780472.1 hypothetical protein N7457_005632 [Penicillium paradoxum]